MKEKTQRNYHQKWIMRWESKAVVVLVEEKRRTGRIKRVILIIENAGLKEHATFPLLWKQRDKALRFDFDRCVIKTSWRLYIQNQWHAQDRYFHLN